MQIARGESFAPAWIMRRAARAIGYVVITLASASSTGGRDGFIDDLYLVPEVRGHGLGRQLLDFALAEATQLGIGTLHLEVETGNERATPPVPLSRIRGDWPRAAPSPAPLIAAGKSMIDQLPTFRTPRLMIRPRTIDDLEACLAMDREPAVTRFIAGPWTEPEAHRIFVEARLRHPFPAGTGYWTVLDQEGFAGWVLLAPLDLHGPEIEIGWRLIRAAWGRGYATEAARPVLNHALHTLKLPEVVADIDPANTASAGIARKLGMQPAGRVPYAGRIVTRYIATPAWRSA